MWRSIALLIGTVALASCRKPAPSSFPHEDEKNFSLVESSDPAMKNAIATARKTSSEFLDAFRHPKPSYHEFYLKKPYRADGAEKEHMWIGDLHEIGDHFEGTIANDAEQTKEVTFGQKVTLKLDEISDWKYQDGERLIGGYTIRYFYDRMTAKEKKSFLEEVGFTIE